MTVDKAPLGAGTQQHQACVEKGVPSFRFHMETIIRKSRWLCFPDTFKIRYFDTSAANMRSTILSYLEIIKMSPPSAVAMLCLFLIVNSVAKEIVLKFKSL